MRVDLNDLYYFVQVVDHGGFAQTGRALGIPKSKLSRRIALLEERLGVRLIQRSTRRFVITEIGQAYYERCAQMLEAANTAQAVIDATRSEPCGTIRLSCPITLLHCFVADMLVDFARHYPRVTLQILDVNRPVDILAEGLDLAIRARPLPLDDSDLRMRVLGYSEQFLVASPGLIEALGAPREPADLTNWPSLGNGHRLEGYSWTLLGPDNAKIQQPHQPTMVTTDMFALRLAALAGNGVVQLPAVSIADDVAQGRLLRVLPAWSLAQDVIHAVFPTGRGLPPSVRALVDFLVERFHTTTGRVQS
jgi:DNA-binding transcriptional LysR family regulator